LLLFFFLVVLLFILATSSVNKDEHNFKYSNNSIIVRHISIDEDDVVTADDAGGLSHVQTVNCVGAIS